MDNRSKSLIIDKNGIIVLEDYQGDVYDGEIISH